MNDSYELQKVDKLNLFLTKRNPRWNSSLLDEIISASFSLALKSLAKRSHGKYCMKLQSTPDNSNLQGKLKKVRVIGSSSYRRWNYEENDLKRKGRLVRVSAKFELARVRVSISWQESWKTRFIFRQQFSSVSAGQLLLGGTCTPPSIYQYTLVNSMSLVKVLLHLQSKPLCEFRWKETHVFHTNLGQSAYANKRQHIYMYIVTCYI